MSCIDAISELLRSLQRERFYGELTIKFVDGQPKLLHKHETILIDNLSTKGTKPNVHPSRQL